MDFDDVVVGIRALLSSTATLYCLNSLLNDFRNTFGCDMPLFGHKNHVEFLKSLKNTIKLFGNPTNPAICLIESKKSSHIISLVKRQKNKPKIPRFCKKPDSIILPEPHSKAYIPPHKRQIYNDVFVQKLENFETLPEKVLTEGNSTVISNNPSTTNENKIIFDFSPLISNQNVDLAQVRNNFNFPNRETEAEKAECYESEKADCCLNEVFSDNESCFSVSETSSTKSSSVQESVFSYGFVNSGIRNKLKKLIEKYPNGIWCCDLPILFQETYNIELDYREFGYTSLIQMVSELPDVFKCYRPGLEDWVLLDSSLPSSQHDEIISKLQLNKNGFLEVEANLKKLLTDSETVSESGMDNEKILQLYEKTYSVPSDCNFKGFSPLLEKLEGNLNFSNVNDITMEIPKMKSSSQSPVACEEALPAITAENDIFYDIFPEDVVGPDENFSEFDLDRHFSVGDKVEVCAAEVWSPTKFYLQLNKYNDKLNKFMVELQNFYNSYLNKYKMPDATIRPNQVCVGFYNSDPEYPEEWNRAIILRVVNEKSVVVRFVDYGTVARVKKTRIRFLHRSFHYLPVQAFSAKLIGIEPLNGEEEWPLSVSKKFLEFLKVPYLIAEMVEVDFKKRTTNVILYDPFKKPILNINSKLVSGNLAKYNETWPKKKAKVEKQTSSPKEFKKGSEDKEKIVSFEFEDVPDLEDSINKNEDREQQTMMLGMKGLTISSKALPDVTNLHLKQDIPWTSTKPKLLNSPTHSDLDSSKKCLTESKQLPPGIDQNYRFKDIPQDFLKLWGDMKKIKNYLSIELLSKNPDLKEIALINPELALSISSQIAEAYISSLTLNSKFCANIPKTDSVNDWFIKPSPTEQSVMPNFETDKFPNTPDSLRSVSAKASSGNNSALPNTPKPLQNVLEKFSSGNDSVLLNTPESLPGILTKASSGNDSALPNTPEPLQNVLKKSSGGNDSVLLNTPDSLPNVLKKSPSGNDSVSLSTPDSLPRVFAKASSGNNSALPNTPHSLPRVLLKFLSESDSSLPNTPEPLQNVLKKSSSGDDSVLLNTPDSLPSVLTKASNQNDSALSKTPEPLPNFPVKVSGENVSSLPKTPELLPNVTVKVSGEIDSALSKTSKPPSKVLKNTHESNFNPIVNMTSKSAPNTSMNSSVPVDDPNLPKTPDELPNISTNQNFNGGPEPGPVSPKASEILPEEQPNQSTHVSSKIQEFVEKTTIQGKIVHIIKMNNQPYICAEELVHSFTFFTNREIADRILQNKRMNFRYEVITKKTNEKLLKALKSTSIFEIINKKKKKKVEVYLLNLQNAVPYLQALGCQTKSYAKFFQDLIVNFEGMNNSEPKPP